MVMSIRTLGMPSPLSDPYLMSLDHDADAANYLLLPNPSSRVDHTINQYTSNPQRGPGTMAPCVV